MQRNRQLLLEICSAVVLGIILFLVTPSGQAQGIIADTITRSFPAKERPLIVLKNVDGRTRITAAAQSEISVRAVKEVHRTGSQEEAKRAAGEVEIRLEQFSNRIEIEAKYPKRWTFFERKPEVLVHIEVIAPKACDLEVQSVDGPLDVEGFEGRIDLKTVDGELRARHCAGRVVTHTVDGDLVLQDLQGEATAQTTDGKLSVDGILGGLDAQSTDGDIDIRVAPGSKMVSNWSIHSSDGRIRIMLPDGFGADLEVRTGDGHIRCDLPRTNGMMDRHRFTGKLHGGGYLLKIRSGDGSIDITR